MKRVGVLGGTFDPPHIAHLILADQSYDQLDLDCVLWVVAGDPPHKQDVLKSDVLHRKHMVELAIQGDSRYSLSRVDLDRAGPHYMVDSLRILALEYAPCELFLLIGGDSLRDMTTWRDPASVVAQAHLVVLKRPDIGFELLDYEQSIPGLTSRTIVLDAPQVDISSSITRKMIRTSQSTRYLIPDAVREYIHTEGLYIGDRSDS